MPEQYQLLVELVECGEGLKWTHFDPKVCAGSRRAGGAAEASTQRGPSMAKFVCRGLCVLARMYENYWPHIERQQNDTHPSMGLGDTVSPCLWPPSSVTL